MSHTPGLEKLSYQELLQQKEACSAEAVALAVLNAEMLEILKRWDEYREAILAKEFDLGSPVLCGLFDDTAKLIQRA